ncbi:aminoglycoside phosphotransferase family protein [Oceanirhabdus sp. W0125-5]|uniref:aminoglycoside phosphotransferase family protein n=1 Tax=Oceanirhabdus sp. W0125-5 TaxID=2999116 RepID=UPI0022F30175|nr:aminoglycoside phosphotransferase family protein [Oceanirhabdus sp. W0125-5]WBW96957.1 aminoglycoside phosphotransferase family protein [Oceanirhabdus sp. W0125-5]
MNNERYNELETITKLVLKEKLNRNFHVKGQQNNNWVFITEGNEYLVKFTTKEELNRLETEVALAKLMGDTAGVPVPKIIHIGEYEGEYYMIRTLLKGEPLGDFLNEEMLKVIGKDSFGEMIYEVGQTLAKLHKVNFTKKGLINKELSVVEYNIFSKEEFMSFLDTVHEFKHLSGDQYTYLKNIDIDHMYSGEFVLCHCDYAPNNILVKNGHLTGIIDYEWASSAPCYDDIAGFHVFMKMYGMEEFIEYFYNGYKSIKDIPKKYFDNILIYKLYRVITMLACQLEQPEDRQLKEFIEKSIILLKELLILLEKDE